MAVSQSRHPRCVPIANIPRRVALTRSCSRAAPRPCATPSRSCAATPRTTTRASCSKASADAARPCSRATSHELSPRRGRAFRSLSLAAADDALVSSDLFGHAKGAFTGADTARAGAIVAASGGTLFLDEIGKASRLVQGKLLRIVEEDGDFHPVGSDRAVSSDVRFIFAANEGLDALVEQDRFLADLRDRISAFSIRIPPLRDRAADIVGLVRHVAGLRGSRCGYADRPPSFDDELMHALENDPWPGNVRELVAAVERLMIDADRRAGDHARSLHRPPHTVARGQGRAPRHAHATARDAGHPQCRRQQDGRRGSPWRLAEDHPRIHPRPGDARRYRPAVT